MSAGYPNVERRDSGPEHLDRTSDEWFAEDVHDERDEVTEERVEWADSMFGVEA